MDPSIGIQRDCDVLVEGNKITKVEQNIKVEDGPGVETVDASTCIICPGFIDTHHHMWQQLLRSVATDWSLADYLAVIRNCYGSLFTPNDVYLSVSLPNPGRSALNISTSLDCNDWWSPESVLLPLLTKI